MKKHISGYKLNRDSAERLALMKSLVASLIAREEIVTTNAKAKAVTPIFEKLLTHAKTDTIAARRLVQAYVQNASLVKRLFAEIAPRYKDVRGGYTKMITVGSRRGDNAPIVRLGLTKKAAKVAKAKIDEAVVDKKKSKTIAAVVPEKVTATKAAPKLVKRTGKRGDK